MHRPLLHIGALALPSMLLLVACSDTARQPTDRFSISAMPLTLGEVGGATYTLTVRSGAPEPNNIVWSKSGISSGRYGDGRGAITYVGPCDASAPEHTVSLVLEGLEEVGGGPIDPDTYVNPAPADRPVVVSATCVPNADTPIVFNLTIMRDAEQGFFDVAVNFEDIFCSAKVDCAKRLLFDGDQRGPTAILGFACTAGAKGNGDAEPTWLHMSDIVLVCDGQPPLAFDPSGLVGQHGPLGVLPTAFESAIYRGEESLPGYDKCYWNAAFGIKAGNAPNCRLRAQATASHAPFGVNGSSPTNTVYPFIDFDVQLTNALGVLICDNNGLDSPNSGVTTEYSAPTGAAFGHEWECGSPTPPRQTRMLCEGGFEGGQQVDVSPTPGGVQVSFGGVRSPRYTLPDGVFLGSDASCCVNPCCDTTGMP